MLAKLQAYALWIMAALILAAVCYAFYQRYQYNTVLVTLTETKGELKTQLQRADILETSLKFSENLRKLANEAIKERDQKIFELEQLKEKSDAQLKQAFKANPEWSNAAVPSSVRDAVKAGRKNKTNVTP